MSRALLLALVAVCALRPTAVDAAAIVIPDHTFRLGSCGGPLGPSCSWDCGVSKSCPADGTCAIHGTNAFGAALSVKLDDTACGGPDGSIMTIGLASSGANPFQLNETAWDLCDRDVTCTGRETRACGTCNDNNGCFSDGGDGEYPCPPGPVVFFCSDPCGGHGPFVNEDKFNDLQAWLRETVQPLPELIRAQLPSPPAVGRPVIYHAAFPPVVIGLNPPEARVCVRVAYTSQDRSLSVCSNDATVRCSTNADCKKGGTCQSGTPASVNPTQPDTVASGSVCAGGTNAGKPCAVGTDCPSSTCSALPPSPTSFCSESGTSCDADPCPGGETCITCPDPSCGDGILDPGEACDLGPTGPGNGCSATCQVEQCFFCEGPLGESSSCFQLVSGEPCDLDGRPCTVDTCGQFGDCQPGGAPTSCAGAVATKAQVQIKRNESNPAKATFKWKWTGAGPFDVKNLGFPATVDEVSVCAYDQSGLVFEATAPADGLCAGKPCWTLKDVKADYKDKEATPDGLTKAQAKSGEAGKGKLQAVGKGVNLDLPALPLSEPVQVLLIRNDGPLCYEATFTTPTKNDEVQFKAKN